MWNHGSRRSFTEYVRLPQQYLTSSFAKEIPLQVAQALKMKFFRSPLKTTLGELLKAKKKAENKQKENKHDQKEEKIEEGTLVVIELKVDMHCEGCARKVRKALIRMEGVEDVEVDVKSHRVIVKGKSVDPVKVCERVQKKSGRKTELISPLPNKEPEENKPAEGAEVNKPAEGAEPSVVTVVLKVHMHCERCADKVTKVIRKMNGVQNAEADLTEQKVTAKGAVDPLNLVNQLYKRTGKHAQIVSQEKEGENKTEDGEKTDDKKEGEEEDKKGEEKGEEKGEGEEVVDGESRKSESSAPMYVIEYIHPPQIFSDENPNSCSIM